ncbi:MAG: putative molybdenum carrier protein [Planctomycetia bacterium]|nr:putative molybdenum carrier protein [Planctomycetia bacterium]
MKSSARIALNTGMLVKIISGGQTGVDRAALDVAIELGINYGGWCPLGRRSEDGVIPETYKLQEAPTANYADRTALNVRDSDATLIIAKRPLRSGTALTQRMADRYQRPSLVVDPHDTTSITKVIEWLKANNVKVLNVAGPRESLRQDVGSVAARFLMQVLIVKRPAKHRPNTSTAKKPIAAKIVSSESVTR